MYTRNLEASEDKQRKIMEVLNSLFLDQQDLRKRVEELEAIVEQVIFWEKIESLEKEKASLLAEMKSLKEKGERKAYELENDVTSLRGEVQALRKLLKKPHE